MPGKLPDLSHLNILLAEDNLTNQLVATQMLDSMGASTKLASDGVEALELYEPGTFDLLLLDIEMPRMSGLDVIRNIRAQGGDSENVPIIALTAYALDEHRTRIREVGADGLISKPILGIQDFGSQILQYVPGATNAQSAEPASETPLSQGAAAQIDVGIFSGLKEAIGEEMMGELLEKVAQDIRACLPALDSQNANFDIAELKSKSHILISVAGAIGATKLQSFAQQLNATAGAGNAEKCGTLCADALEEAHHVLAFVAGQTG